MLSVSVVMFAYNEEANVRPCMVEALEFLASATSEHELILVDDGSSDGTADVAREVMAEYGEDRVQVVSYSPNRGIGGALKAGFAVARRDWVSCLPADGQVPPSGLQNLFDVVEGGGADLVTCHFPHRFDEADNLLRKVLSRGLRVVLWCATGVDRKMDGVYLIPRETVQGLDLRSETFFLNLELPIRAIRSGMTPGETTMHIRPRMSGQSKVLNVRRIRMVLRETLRLGAELRFGLG